MNPSQLYNVLNTLDRELVTAGATLAPSLETGMEQILDDYLTKGGKIDAIIDPANGYSLLHKAIKDGTQGKVYLINLLIRKGANTELQAHTEQTPRQLAEKNAALKDRIQWKPLPSAAQTTTEAHGTSFVLPTPVTQKIEEPPKDHKVKNKIIELIKEGEVQRLKAFVEHNDEAQYTLMEKFEHGRTAMHLAAECGSIPMLEFLFNGGYSTADKLDDNKQSALSLAAINDHIATVRWLLSKGVTRNRSDVNGYSPLHYACLNGNLLMVKLLSWGENLYSLPRGTAKSGSPFHIACERGHVAVVEYFLKYLSTDFLLETHNKDGSSGLHFAAANGHYGVVNLFLRYQGNKEVIFKNSDQLTPMDRAKANGHTEIVELLESKQPNTKTKIFYERLKAKSSDDARGYILKKLMRGANIDRNNKEGFNCLHLAVKEGNLDLVKLLIEVGDADINHLTGDGLGYAPLHLAAKNGDDDMVHYLILMGAAKDIKAANSITKPIDLAKTHVRTTLANYRASFFRL